MSIRGAENEHIVYSLDARPSGSFHTAMPRYPLATVAAYGPDNTFATKLVVSILERDRQREPPAMRTWTTVAIDVRSDPTIAADVRQFLDQHRVKERVEADRIIGCPHEEGIDYPMGRVCPRCPFWADIDRFTHEPVTASVPIMSPADVLDALSQNWPEPPHEALASAEGHRRALVEPLLLALERGIANPTGASSEEAMLFAYSLYLLAKWREPRAYPLVVRWLSLPGDAPFDLAGDIVTQDGSRMLAGVCDGDLTLLEALVLDRQANEYGRGAAVGALSHLAVWAEVPRESVVEHFLWLAREGLEREPGHVWDCLAVECADIEALAVFPELRRAYDEGLVDPQCMGRSELDEVERAPRGETLRETRERDAPIDDVVKATSWWAGFATSRRGPLEPYRAPPKVGRNDPCPCGSGKKYKKCCGA